MASHAVKIGMLADCGHRRGRGCRDRRARPAAGGRRSGDDRQGRRPPARDDAVDAMRRELLPHTRVLTPNIPEAEALTGMTIRSVHGHARPPARRILAFGPRVVLVKGGHLDGPESVDVAVSDGVDLRDARGRAWTRASTHGTGCTLSSAIAANLALGLALWTGTGARPRVSRRGHPACPGTRPAATGRWGTSGGYTESVQRGRARHEAARRGSPGMDSRRYAVIRRTCWTRSAIAALVSNASDRRA